MSCYEGLLELYKVTKNPLYLSVVEKTMNHIINEEINVAGSGSAFECWYGGKALQTYPTYHTMETCDVHVDADLRQDAWTNRKFLICGPDREGYV